MTILTKLVLKNFKSFKKAEVPFAHGFTAIAGANGSGKCVTGETKVLLPSGESKEIREIVHEKLETAKRKQVLEDGVIGFNDDPNFKVLSLNPVTLKVEERTVAGVVKRLAPERLLTITTRTGRRITTTDYHPLFSINQTGIYSLEAKDLKEKQFIAIPRNYETVKKSVFLSEFLDIIEPKDKLYVQFNEKYLELLNQYFEHSRATVKEAAAEFGIPVNAIKGLFDKQAINFAFLVRILKRIGYDDETIAELIPRVKGKNTRLEAKMVWRNSVEFSRLLGYMFAEGSVAGKNIRMVTETEEMIQDIKEICRNIFGIEINAYKYKPKAFDLILYSHPVYLLLSKFGLGEGVNAKTKKLSSLFFRHSNEEHLTSFLDGYLSGDGYISKSVIECTSASNELAENVVSIYLGLGILASKREIKKGIKNRSFTGTYYSVTVSGFSNIEKFIQKIRITNKKKMLRVTGMIGKRRHSNNDLIPNINSLIKSACKEHGVQYASKKHKKVKLGSYIDNACYPSRNGLQEVLREEFDGKQSQQTIILQSLAHSDIFWDEIAAIEEVKDKPTHVYDLSVNYSHNFIANNIFAHNSNILDSVLFAMGATSLKMLRVSRLTELVNNDSSEGYAKAELTLNSKGKEITISRIIDRQGRSIFKVDDRKKTLNEVQALLIELGVNPNGHNIVVQGDVTHIIEMNAKQRLQIIEEAAGLQEFEEKKEEALKKLDQVEQRVKEAMLVLSEREAYLKQIEQDRENALRYTRLGSELKSSKATIIDEELRLTRAELDRAKEKMAAIGKEIEFARQERMKMQDEEIILEKKVEEITQRLIEAGEKTYSTFGKEIEQRRGHINLINERIQARNETVEGGNSRQAQLASEVSDLEKLRKEREAALSEARKGLAKTGEELSGLKAAMRSKTPEFDKKRAEFAAKEAKAAELLDELGELKEQLHSTMLQKHGIEREYAVAQQSAAELEAARRRLDEKVKGKKDVEKKIQAFSTSDPDARLKAREQEIEKLVSEVHHLKGRAASIEEALRTIAKAKAECPTCDKPLEKELKDRIALRKTKELEELKQKAKTAEALIEKLYSEKTKLAADSRELAEAIAMAKSLRGVEDELAAVQARLQASYDLSAFKKIRELGAKEAELQKKVEALEREKKSITEAIEEFRKADSRGTFDQLLGRLNELNERKSGYEKTIAEISAELEHSIAGRKSAAAKEAESIQKESSEAKKELAEMLKEKNSNEAELKELEAEMEKAGKANKVLEEEKARLLKKVEKASQRRDQVGLKAESLEKEVNELNIAQSRNFVRVTDLEEETKDYGGVQKLEKFNLNELKKRIPEIETEMEKIGPVNMKALNDYEPFMVEVEEMRAKAGMLDEERKAVLEMIDKINVRKFSVFMECFELVSRKFSELYSKFFDGTGMLSLTDEVNPFDGGLLIQAKYRQDSMKGIDAMSGGEKSLTALAFIFAMQSFEPAPFYIMDEVDAALDKDNSVKIVGMVKSMSRESQFVAISHNDAIVNQADQIIGVALNKQKSSVIGLKLGKELQRKSQGEEDQQANAETGTPNPPTS